jgi:hypothetical protein
VVSLVGSVEKHDTLRGKHAEMEKVVVSLTRVAERMVDDFFVKVIQNDI